MSFTSYILALMVWLLPVEKGVEAAQHLPEARETIAERQARYESISRDLAEVIDRELTTQKEKEQMAATILAVTYHESGWHKHVDFGIGPRSRGDQGRSWCLAQVNIGLGVTPEGWSGKDLVEDRQKCLTAAVRTIRKSFGACRGLPLEHRLSAYASGNCLRGREASARRMRTTTRLLEQWSRLRDPEPQRFSSTQ